MCPWSSGAAVTGIFNNPWGSYSCRRQSDCKKSGCRAATAPSWGLPASSPPLPWISAGASLWPNPVGNQRAGEPSDADVKFSSRQRAEKRVQNKILEEQEENI